jgi:hypothetical protein
VLVLLVYDESGESLTAQLSKTSGMCCYIGPDLLEWRAARDSNPQPPDP